MNDNKLHTIICKSLDQDTEGLDASIQSRLTQARSTALEELDKSNTRLLFTSFVGDFFGTKAVKIGTALAAVTFISLSTFSSLNLNGKNVESGQTVVKALPKAEQINPNAVYDSNVGKEFFLTEEDLDFFENLDLYQWLDSEFKIS